MLGRWMRFLTAAGMPWRPIGEPPSDRQELGEEARRLLDNPVLHEAMDRVEQTLVETWKRSDPSDAEGREAVFAVYQGMQKFRGQLQQMIANAGMATRGRGEP